MVNSFTTTQVSLDDDDDVIASKVSGGLIHKHSDK